MAATAVTPQPGLTSTVATGGTAVPVANGGINGGYITNPASASDQGLGGVETLYIDPVTDALTQANGTTFALSPGQTWTMIPGQTTPTSVNAASSGHRFSVVVF